MFSLAQWLSVAAQFATFALAIPSSTSSHHAGGRSSLAPMVAVDHPHGTIDNSYIVVFKDGVTPVLIESHLNFVEKAHYSDFKLGESVAEGIQHIYGSTIRGYSGEFTPSVLEQIRMMPEVDFVEKDQVVRATVTNITHTSQRDAPWGLARISHRERLTLSTFRRYEYNNKGGYGVDVYVIDTGIDIDHDEFEGRAFWGRTVNGEEDTDWNGHGTHCAGTIASRKYGVAKQAHVYAVKVLNSRGDGPMSDVVAGVEWTSATAQEKARAALADFAATGETNHKGSVASMSLGGGKSRALEVVISSAIKNGLHFAVAAGNDNTDACSYSPSGVEKAVTVGASTLDDERAYFSNWGKCLNVFAPGLDIVSTYKGGDIATMSGTSMACPHTAGLMAYLLSIYPSYTFNPMLSMIPAPSEPNVKYIIVPRWIHALAYATLPRWIVGYLPTPQSPLPVYSMEAPVLSPDELKLAIIELSTPEILEDINWDTPNRLIFNNATA